MLYLRQANAVVHSLQGQLLLFHSAFCPSQWLDKECTVSDNVKLCDCHTWCSQNLIALNVKVVMAGVIMNLSRWPNASSSKKVMLANGSTRFSSVPVNACTVMQKPVDRRQHVAYFPSQVFLAPTLVSWGLPHHFS